MVRSSSILCMENFGGTCLRSLCDHGEHLSNTLRVKLDLGHMTLSNKAIEISFGTVGRCKVIEHKGKIFLLNMDKC